MRVKDLERLFDYSYWANQQLFGVISQLTPEQFTQTVAGSYGSIRNTLVHVLSAEWGWLDRCGGPERGERLKAENYPTVESLVGEWNQVEGYMRRFVSGLKDEDLAREIEFAIGGGPKHSIPLGDLMHHAAVHAAHHRGQVALLLRTLDYVPGNFDMLFYATDKRSMAAGAVRPNRSIPPFGVLPELAYADVAAAVTWLCDVFGFQERLRIGNHRAQLLVGSGAVVVMDRSRESSATAPNGHGVLVRVENVDAHFARAVAAGAEILSPPTTQPFGERQYSAQDVGGHRWTFSETVSDSDPASWGGSLFIPTNER